MAMNQNHEFEKYKSKKLPSDFYLQSTTDAAKQLLGKVLVKNSKFGLITGVISEVEAYLHNGDLASHSAVGITKRNSAMFSDGGILYVYKIYGIHHCINVVTEPAGHGAAVLIRSINPLEGVKTMMENRQVNIISKLCSGPGNLAKALGINLNDNFTSLLSDEIFISEEKSINNPKYEVTNRIGITKSAELPLRFVLKS